MIQCADPLLLSGTYKYTDSTGTYCSGLNTSLIDSCINNLTAIQFNDSLVTDSDCAALNPGWSGKLQFYRNCLIGSAGFTKKKFCFYLIRDCVVSLAFNNYCCKIGCHESVITITSVTL